MGLRERAVRAATSKPGVAARRAVFRGSRHYWERRYARGGTSGSGSYGAAAQWKADTVNAWVRDLGVTSVVDYGCGDGNQLGLADYPRYLGLDRSDSAIKRCSALFAADRTKSFLQYDPETLSDPAGWLRADLALSMEVLFHLVEDAVFEDYLTRLFDSAERYVVVCSSDVDLPQKSPHERHRAFTGWVATRRPEWRLEATVDPPQGVDLLSSFHLYARA
ncbi:hypothetical protein GCM10009867_35690 [Pedococcus aerophilus]|uniref:Methyltransferase domain-containing protein n=1 Tax=Pedococcus aerophilus TaxID=436356 RepID=A0ABN3UWZ6_9MICO